MQNPISTQTKSRMHFKFPITCIEIKNYPTFEDAIIHCLYMVEMTEFPLTLLGKYGSYTIAPDMTISEISKQFKKKMPRDTKISAEEQSKIQEILVKLAIQKESGIFYRNMLEKQASMEK